MEGDELRGLTFSPRSVQLFLIQPPRFLPKIQSYFNWMSKSCEPLFTSYVSPDWSGSL
jgi:hypothetical protein